MQKHETINSAIFRATDLKFSSKILFLKKKCKNVTKTRKGKEKCKILKTTKTPKAR